MTDPVDGVPLAASQAILNPLSDSAIFLVLTVAPGNEQLVHDALGDISGLVRSVGFRVPDGVLTCITSIGSDAWSRLFDGPRPKELHVLPEFHGAVHASVTTPGDILFHIRAKGMDLCFELASLLVERFGGYSAVVDEVHGFKYFEERDLLGFVDGTENPTGALAVQNVIVRDDVPQFVGGSYVVVQKYLHNLTAWNTLTVEQQEQAIGRGKADNVEQAEEKKAPNAHTVLTVLTDADGNELKIVRDNMPFGRIGEAEFGTYFIGYAKTPAVTERMLKNMFVGDPEGNYDRILDFSTAVTGSLYFTPTGDFLDDPPPLPS
nr:Dyp-type peroxidase [Clavibacter michiganensis]